MKHFRVVHRLTRRIMDALYAHGLQPFHPSSQGAVTPFALGVLYLRGHWLRMPPWQLAQHLWRKAFVRPQETENTP